MLSLEIEEELQSQLVEELDTPWQPVTIRVPRSVAIKTDLFVIFFIRISPLLILFF